MTFGDMRLLLALLVCVPVLVVAYAFDGQRRRRVLERIGNHAMIARMTASSSPARRRWRAVLSVTAVTLLCIALGRPQIPGRAKLTESRGLDLVVALDFSRSMLARDVYPSRLERAKAELNHLIDSLKGDRVGLVAFAGETMAYPLTIDYEAAKLFWRDLGPDDMPVGGTDLGRALTASLELLQRARKADDKRKGAQVILLLTDGEDTEGRGLEVAKEAQKRGVHIYTLGVGSPERPFVQLFDESGKPTGYLEGEDGKPVRVGLDEGGLRQIAALTGGDYFALDPRRFGVDRVQQAIASLERTQEDARFEREPEDVGRWFLVPAFILMMAAACVRERKRVRQSAAPAAEPGGPVAEVRRAAVVLLFFLPFVTGFDLFMRRDPNVEEGNRQLQAGKAEAALEAYDRAAESLPDEPVVRFDRGAALYQLGEFPEAQKEFQRAAEGHEPAVKADAYYNMGNALMKQERWKDALEAYKHTLGLRPEDRRAKWNLELALRRLREQKQQQQNQPNADNKNKDDKDKKDPQKNSQQQAQQNPANGDKEKEKQEQAKREQEKQKAEQQKQEQKPQKQQSAEAEREKEREKEREQALAKKEPVKEIDKQDAEAVLDALERVEPTVQKDLARRRAGNRRPTKDY